MQNLEDDPLAQSVQPLPVAAAALRFPHKHLPADAHPLAQSQPSLPFRDSNNGSSRRPPSSAAAASLFRSTLTPPGSRSASPSPSLSSAGPFSPTTGALTGSIFGGSTLRQQSLLEAPGAADNPGDPLNLILKSFVPHVAVRASADVDALVRDKGFSRGLWELLRPFGERVQGKVTIRDSNGGARSWEDFAIRFTRFGEGVEEPVPAASQTASKRASSGGDGGDVIAQVERVVDRHLSFAEEAWAGMGIGSEPGTPTPRYGVDVDATSPYYALYLRRLLSGIPLAAHESFAHPVACVMAISSREPAPIEALHKLYTETAAGAKTQGEGRMPAWVDSEYLRYYVLVHDEEHSDITKSMALFEQMKRNFGLHCHLLRIRSTQSAETDDDSIPLPRSDWMTAAEELADIEGASAGSEADERDEFADRMARYMFESDATAIRTFVREMVTQSIIPTMERNVSVWNDQVASRRRGISGRFMSLSKRWAFGSSSNRNSGSGGTSSSSSNYDALGFYRPDAPEAIMRRLADYCFMLRDWKLAMSTYDLLRTDFSNDKAWRYHAAANEMAAMALLIMPQNMSSKTRIETINQMLEQAFYSYHTRCSSRYGTIRCIVLALELLRLRGGSGVDEAVRWGVRVLESKLLGDVGDALLKERMAICYACKAGAGSKAWGGRKRKSALWSVLAAEAWVQHNKFVQGHKCLSQARRMYGLLPGECGVQGFAGASEFLAALSERIKSGMGVSGGMHYGESGEEIDEEESEVMHTGRARRASVMVAGGGGPEVLEKNDKDGGDGFG